MNRDPLERAISEFPERAKLWLRLWHVRALLGLTDLMREWVLSRWNPGVSSGEVEAALNQIFGRARERINSWGGKLVVVYLPGHRTYGYGVEHPWRNKVLAQLSGAGLPVIDMVPVFASHPDPVGLFNYRKNGHYTSEGNALVAQAVLAYVRNNDRGGELMQVTNHSESANASSLN